MEQPCPVMPCCGANWPPESRSSVTRGDRARGNDEVFVACDPLGRKSRDHKKRPSLKREHRTGTCSDQGSHLVTGGGPGSRSLHSCIARSDKNGVQEGTGGVEGWDTSKLQTSLFFKRHGWGLETGKLSLNGLRLESRLPASRGFCTRSAAVVSALLWAHPGAGL